MEDLDRMLALVQDTDPQIRRYAISQLQVLAEGHDEEEVMEALRGALSDPVPLVSHQANRTLAHFLNRSLGLTPREGGGTSAMYEGVSLGKIREAGMRLLRPLLERLIAFAGSGDFEVAKRAIIALGKIGDPSSLPVLSTAIRKPDLAKVAAIALSQLDNPNVLPPLLAAADDPESAVRQHAVLELGRFADVRALDALLANRNHPHPSVRANVAVALGEYPDRAASLRTLLKMLEDREIWVVLEVVLALSRFHEAAACDAIIDKYHTGSDEHVKATTISALGRIGLERAQALCEKALAEPNDRVRANAVEALTQVRATSPTLVNRLTPLLADPSNRVRANAAVGVYPHAGAAALEAVDRMLASDDVWFRASAAWALGRMPGPGALQRLVRLLGEEPASEVLFQAIRALESFRDAKVVDPLVKLLDHSSASIRARAAKHLGRLEDRSLWPALSAKYLRENDSEVRGTLIGALGPLVEARDTSFIQQALEKDPDPRVQANALSVLAARGGITSLPGIRPFVASVHNRIKANAVLALFNQGEFEVVSSLHTMLEATHPRQFYSAIYVVGEIGRRMRNLRGPNADVHLLSSLRGLYLNSSGVSERQPTAVPVRMSAGGGAPSREERLEKMITAALTRTTPQPGTPGPEEDVLAALLFHRLAGVHEMTPAYRAVLERLNGAEKDFVNPALELAQAASRNREAPEMIRAYLEAYERRVRLVDDQIKTTRELLDAGKHAEAVVCLKELSQTLPLRGDTHLRLGRLYLALKLAGPAMRHLMLAHVESPTDVDATYDYACACFQKGALRLARQLCNQIVRVAGDTAPVVPKARRMLASIKEQGEAE